MPEGPDCLTDEIGVTSILSARDAASVSTSVQRVVVCSAHTTKWSPGCIFFSYASNARRTTSIVPGTFTESTSRVSAPNAIVLGLAIEPGE